MLAEASHENSPSVMMKTLQNPQEKGPEEDKPKPNGKNNQHQEAHDRRL